MRRGILVALALAASLATACDGSSSHDTTTRPGAPAMPTVSMSSTPVSTTPASAGPSSVVPSSSAGPSTARITDAKQLATGSGPLAKQILGASLQCTKPVYGICLDDQAVVKSAVTKAICARFASTVPAVATALGFDMRAQHIRGGVTSITDGELLGSDPWELIEARCQWFGTPEARPTVTMNIGLVWRVPLSEDCTVYLIGTCKALTPQLLQVDDTQETSFFFQMNATAGAAVVGVSTYERPKLTAAQIAGADVAIKKVAAQITALDP